MPKVSALLPTYNTQPEHLRECIDSILSQTFSDFELVIVDDCSTNPEVKEVIKSYSDKRIRFFENEKNLGISGSRNRLIDLAQGEYLAVVDHDDISLPERFEKQVAFLDAHPEVGVAGAAFKVMPKMKLIERPEENDKIENFLMFDCAVMHPVCMIRKDTLLNTGIRYDEHFTPAEDYHLWVELIGKTFFANLKDVLLHYNHHEKNTSHTSSQAMTNCGCSIAYMARSRHPEIFHRAMHHLETSINYKLFGVLPIMRIVEKNRRKNYFLFGCIPIIKGRKYKKHL